MLRSFNQISPWKCLHLSKSLSTARNLEILYEDNHLLVVNKPAGMVSQPNDKTPQRDCMYDMIKNELMIRKGKQSQDNVYLGLVHRLDRTASGVLLTAKTSKAASRLSEAIKKREFGKYYISVVHGVLNGSGVCKGVLRVFKDDQQDEGKLQQATLSYESLASFSISSSKFSVLKVKLDTGRKHQIRAQLASMGHPIIGDLRYQPTTSFHSLPIDQSFFRHHMIALHAYEVEFLHPVTKELLRIQAPIPILWQKYFPQAVCNAIKDDQKRMINDEEKLLEMVSRTSSDEIITIDFNDDPPSPESSHSLLQTTNKDESLDDSKHNKRKVMGIETNRWIRIGLCTLISLIIAVIVCGILRVYTWNSHLQSTVVHTDPSLLEGQNHSFNIVLFGDSLINMPFEKFNLGGFLEASLTIPKESSVAIINEGRNSDTVLEMYQRMNTLSAYDPDAVLLLWDSDVSDTSFEDLSEEDFDIVKITYVNFLRDIISTLRENNIRYIAVSGPILFGEGTWFARKQFANKDSYLQQYIEMNRAVCEEMKVKYIDLHKKFIKKLPWYWFPSRYYLTVDGEHPNRTGTKLIAKAFAKVLNEMITAGKEETVP